MTDKKNKSSIDEEIIRLDDDIDDQAINDMVGNLAIEEDGEDTDTTDAVLISKEGTFDNQDDSFSHESDEVPQVVERTKTGSIKEDSKLEKAIEDIVAEEADVVLEAEDKARLETDLAEDDTNLADTSDKKFTLRKLFKNSKFRWTVTGLLLVIIFTLALIPGSRYFLLNTASIRASVEMKVVDGATMQPLKNVTVKIGSSEAKTNNEGFAKLERVRLGKGQLKIEKRAFAEVTKPITVGWGSNPLGEFKVEPVGSKYTFNVRNFLSGKPVVKAEATSGDGNALSDEDGKVVLVLDTQEMNDAEQIEVDIIADGYRTEKVKLAVNNKESQNINIVPSKPHMFVSKRSGKYDVYAIDVDGKNERRILAGEGFERDGMSLAPHPKKNIAAYVATRENVRDSDGYLLSTLYIINADTSDILKIDQSEQIKIIGWSESRLVYVKITAGASGTDPNRHRIMSINTENFEDKNSELASSNLFNDVTLVDGQIYYAPSNIFNEEATPKTYSIKPDGKDKRVILDKESHSIIRGKYDTLYFDTGDQWYEYVLGSPGTASKTNPPASQRSRTYIDNTYNKFSLWVDSRDGKGVLLSHDKSTDHEKVIVEMSGIKYPVVWLDEKNIIFRVSNGRETADYIVSTDGGEPYKITDVTDSEGLSSWYYY